MTNTAAILKSEVAFAKQKNGYDKEQVDRYIRVLSQAYQTAYEEHKTISGNYRKLQEEYAQLEQQAQSNKTNAQAITKTLVDAEVMAQKIISDAHAEADKIKGDAYIEKIAAKRSLEAANEHITQTISKLQNMMTA